MSEVLEALHRLYLTNNTKLPYCKNGECLKDYELVEKELKALEIIKNHCCVIQKGILPKEKQDLLDEVLLCH